jgi:hypothetical protein
MMKGVKFHAQVIRDRTVDHFEVCRNNVEGNYGRVGADYLFDSGIQEAYLQRECT